MIFKLTDQDNGKTVTAVVNDKVIVSLSINMNGFFWQDSGTTVGPLEEVQHDRSRMPGAPTLVNFTFKIQRSGFVTLSYAKPWSETEPPAKLFEVKVNINKEE